jgi:hypothetical protein
MLPKQEDLIMSLFVRRSHSILLLFLTCACICEGGGASSPTSKAVPRSPVVGQGVCRPSFTPVAEEAIVARLDPAIEFGARAVLIGCETDLASISSAEKFRIAQFVRQVLVKEHYVLSRETFDSGFRSSMVREINALLPRPVVTDVVVFGIYSKEFKVE